MLSPFCYGMKSTLHNTIYLSAARFKWNNEEEERNELTVRQLAVPPLRVSRERGLIKNRLAGNVYRNSK